MSFSLPSNVVYDFPHSVSSACLHLHRVHQITQDHTPAYNDAEAKRVLSQGGQLCRIGDDVRVFPKHLTLEEARTKRLALNMSRALGHRILADHGVSAEPEFTAVQLPSSGKVVIVIASDGLWDVYDNDAVGAVVAANTNVQQSCEALLLRADSQWKKLSPNGDNITVIVAEFRAVP